MGEKTQLFKKDCSRVWNRMVRMGRDMMSHKIHSYTETSEFKRDGFCFHLELDMKGHYRQHSYFWLCNDLFTGRKKDILSQSCISWDGFKTLRSLERKKGKIYSFLKIKRSRLWAKCYTGPLWGRESHVLQEVKRKDNRPSAAAHLRAGGWDRHRRMSAMALKTTFEGVWNGPHHGGHPLPLSSQSYSQGKVRQKTSDGAQSGFLNLK